MVAFLARNMPIDQSLQMSFDFDRIRLAVGKAIGRKSENSKNLKRQLVKLLTPSFPGGVGRDRP
jgi:hypothetical protein